MQSNTKRNDKHRHAGGRLQVHPAPKVPAADLAWAAGLFEGEGTFTIGIRRSDETYRIIAMVGNTDFQIIEFFRHRWDGYISQRKDAPGRKTAWHWTLIGPRAYAFIRQIRPFLRTDRVLAKADLCIAFRQHKEQNLRTMPLDSYKAVQRDMYRSMRRLNARGASARNGDG